MKIGLVRLFFAGLAIGCVTSAPAINTPEKAMSYLNRFGYMKSSEMRDGMPMNGDVMKKSIEYFQIFANINMTGSMDNKTYEMMNLPRCGIPDMDDSEGGMVRKRRYALSPPWNKVDLSWRVDSRTLDLPDRAVDRILEEALKVWSDNSLLTFEKRSTGEAADILIEFAKGAHGDNDAFDGKGGVLAHAFFPLNGDAHFDDDETYTDGTYEGTNLFQVAAHEFGHSLGLDHSQIEGALMYPFYSGYVENFKLHDDDIDGIQALYGVDSGKPEEKPSTPMTDVVNCMTRISIATSTADGSYYLANETHVFKIVSNTLIRGYPKRISDEFPGLPDNLDAGLFYDDKTYMFKGNQFWRLTNQAIDSGYPKAISTSKEFNGLPGDLDAAFVWSGNGRIYFTKGEQYYRVTLNYGVDERYPLSLANWDGLPSRVDAALQYSNRMTYFFSDTSYYRYDDMSRTVNGDVYPRNTAVWWLGCDPSVVDDTEATMPSSAASLLLPPVFAFATAMKFL